MIYEMNEATSKLDEFRAEAQVLVPVLKAAREELGEERANALILGALRDWGRERFRHIGADIPGSPQEKWQAIKDLDMKRTRKDDLDFAMLRWDAEAVEYDVTRCKYAELFRELGEPELGEVLVCGADTYLSEEVTGPDVTYTRSQCLMTGGCLCDVRWRISAEPAGSDEGSAGIVDDTGRSSRSDVC
jgi:hypothetical protein